MKLHSTALGLAVVLLAVLGWWLYLPESGPGGVALESPAEQPTGDGGSGAALESPPATAGTVEATTADVGAQSARRAAPEPDPPTPARVEQDVEVIEVLAVDRAGQPVPGATVTLELRDEAEFSSSSVPFRFGTGEKGSSTADITGENEFANLAVTDAGGFTHFRILDPRLLAMHARIVIRGSKQVGREILRPPLSSGRHKIELLDCPRVEVSVVDSSRRPRVGAFVDVSAEAAAVAALVGTNVFEVPHGRFAKTNASGIALFDDLPEGAYEFRYRDPKTGTASSQVVQAAFGGSYFVELQSAEDPSKPLCISGRVLDERGQPLPKIPVRLSLDGEADVAVISDAQGQFGYSCAAGREVALSVGGGMFDDDFEPSSLRVPFGTREVLLQRVSKLEIISVEFVVLDGTSGEVVSGRHLYGKRYRAGTPQDKAQFGWLDKGRTSLMFRERDDWHVVISGYGYVEQDIALAEAMTRGPSGNQVVIRLQRSPTYERDKGDAAGRDN